MPVTSSAIDAFLNSASFDAARSALLSFGSLTASNPLEVTQTWNNAGVTFTGLRLNATDTASASGSLLMDLQVGGVSMARVNKGGRMDLLYLVAGGFVTAPTLRSSSDVGEITLGSASDIALKRDAAGILAQRNGANAQELRLYNTYTDASNGEWLELGFQDAANTAVIKTASNGTGTARNLYISAPDIRLRYNSAERLVIGAGGIYTAANILPLSDLLADIGSAGTRMRDMYVGRNVYLSGLPTSDPAVAGQLWSNSGVLTVSAG